MIIKTDKFVKNLNSKLYQFTFNKKLPLRLKGSFKNVTYVSDIDFQANIHINQQFLNILVHKINNLKDFVFMYITSGTNTSYKIPWDIHHEKGCNFNLKNANNWIYSLKNNKLISNTLFEHIYNILNKDNLKLGNLIEIQNLIGKFCYIKWFLPDIIRGYQILDGNKYYLLDTMKNGAIISSLYIDNSNIVPNIVSIDIALVDRRFKTPIWRHMHQFYTQNWYKIFKEYKKYIKTEYEQEYKTIRKILEFTNSLLAESELLNNILTYNNSLFIGSKTPIAIRRIAISPKYTNILVNNLRKDLHGVNIYTQDLNEINSILVNTLNNKSKPYINYFLDKLTEQGKIKMYKLLRLTDISSNPTPIKTIIEREKKGIKCPFFDTDLQENINSIAHGLMLNQAKLNTCFEHISEKEHITTENILKHFYNFPRLFISKHNNNGQFRLKTPFAVRGTFNDTDHKLFSKIGIWMDNFYEVPPKLIKRVQIYIISGI